VTFEGKDVIWIEYSPEKDRWVASMFLNAELKATAQGCWPEDALEALREKCASALEDADE
jgi:hypothetical protein